MNFQDGDKVVFGAKGIVMGPVTNGQVRGKGVAVLFPGNTQNVNCFLHNLGRVPPVSAARLRCEKSHICVIGRTRCLLRKLCRAASFWAIRFVLQAKANPSLTATDWSKGRWAL